MTLTITHSHEAGTLIEGTAKGDGTAEALKANRWRWGRSIGAWYVPHSRDKNANQHRIDTTADALRDAGFTVEIYIDNFARPTADVEADKAARADARADALAAKADRKEAAAANAEASHRAAVDRLPEGGEPVKLGHHSAPRHLRAIDRAHNAMGRSVEANRAAEEAQRKAQTASAATGARYAPVTVANRIERLEAEGRKNTRSQTGYTSHQGTPYEHQVPPATGTYRERLMVEADRLAEELDYWRGVRAAQVEAGEASNYSREDFSPGDYAQAGGIGSSWWKVKRANPKTLTLEARGCQIKAPYATIIDHKTAAEVEGTDAEHH